MILICNQIRPYLNPKTYTLNPELKSWHLGLGKQVDIDTVGEGVVGLVRAREPAQSPVTSH